MRWLVGFEFSGQVRRALRKRGHDAWSCDLLPAEDGSPFHYQCDVREVIGDGWDGGIFHPECTYLTNSGVRWLHSESLRWQKLIEAAVFFREILDAPIPHVAVENPVMHHWAGLIVGQKHTQLVQPWMFGHPESKATCLWLKNLPSLLPTNDVREQMRLLPAKERSRVHYASPGPDRWKERSRTLPGFAEAFAEQWGNLGALVAA